MSWINESDATCIYLYFIQPGGRELTCIARGFRSIRGIATGSLFKVVSQTTIALRRQMIEQRNYNKIYAVAEKQSKMLNGLRRLLSQA